jgi:hypothetical protein
MQYVFTRLLWMICLLGLSSSLKAQNYFAKMKENYQIKPFMMVQLWSTYSTGQQVFNAETGEYEAVDDQFNTQIRRARLGFRAQPYEQLKFTFVGYYDLIGRDAFASTIGGYNPQNSAVGGNPDFGIWDAFFTWKILKNSEALNLVGGYFRPQLSRESITSGWSVNSFEKSMSQTYIRQHLVGTGPGRAAGLNLGGTILSEGLFGLNYNVGLFNPVRRTSPQFGSVGANYSPLLVARAVLYIGDPEQTTYKIGYDINYYNKRKGLSIGFGGSTQGETDVFDRSQALGLDFLFNYGPLNVDGDFNFMQRQGSRVLGGTEEVRTFTYNSNTGHIRAGYNLILADKYFLEPTFMIMQFNGGQTQEAQADARAVNAFSGSEATYDVGINWYLNKKNLKLMLHYVWNEGDMGAANDGFTGNAFFSQGAVGPIQRGNWLGLGLHAIF